MNVILARAYGFCFGVRDALDGALEAARSGPVTVLGELVHNPRVLEKLARAGIGSAPLDAVRPLPGRVLVTAHGAAPWRIEAWRAAGQDVGDLTCPLVHRAHRQLAELVKKGCRPVVIGQPGHVEVRGMTESFPDVAVILTAEEAAALPSAPRFGVVAQTTQPIARVRAVVDALRRAHPGAEVEFRDTVCQPTKDRQEAVEKLCRRVRLVVVVGGRRSNNTLQLCRTIEASGARALHVESAAGLRPEWFAGVTEVGLTAGTSTPEEAVAEVRGALERWETTPPAPREAEKEAA
jgi:4-hydroxy-3-methylbut-2-enyl diphosphate reductase